MEFARRIEEAKVGNLVWLRPDRTGNSNKSILPYHWGEVTKIGRTYLTVAMRSLHYELAKEMQFEVADGSSKITRGWSCGFTAEGSLDRRKSHWMDQAREMSNELARISNFLIFEPERIPLLERVASALGLPDAPDFEAVPDKKDLT